MFQSINDENDHLKSSPTISQQCHYNHKPNENNVENNLTPNNSFQFRTNTEILFDLFPSIFMSYLDADTFCNLLKTDLWHWGHLLSDRIIYDYFHYISLKYTSEIEKFCDKPTTDITYDSSDSVYYNNSNNINIDDDYEKNKNENEEEEDFDEVIDDSVVEDVDLIKDIKDEEQNFAILKFNTSQDINDCDFIFNYFKNIDIISDRMLLTESQDIGLSANLCKTVTINSHDDDIQNHNHHENDIIFSFDSFNQLQTTLVSQCFFNEQDIMHIQHILLIDVLSYCPIDKWYFVEWHQNKGEYFEYNKVFTIIEIKQMIIAHFKNKKCCDKNNNNQQLCICWSIEWQQQMNDNDNDENSEMSLSSISKEN